MKKGILMQPMYDPTGLINKVAYVTDPYATASGLLRNVQKFAVILLTTKGTDSIRPWFGTQFPSLSQSNFYSLDVLKGFVSEQVESAKTQFFTLQDSDSTLTSDDKVQSISLANVVQNPNNTFSVYITFKPVTSEAITVSLTA